MADEWLDLPSAAARLSISVDTLRRKLRNGSITGRKAETSSGWRWEVLVRDGTAVGSEHPAVDIPLGSEPPAVGTGVSIGVDTTSPAVGTALDPAATDRLIDLVKEQQQTIMELAGRVGFYQAQVQAMQERIALLTAPIAPPAPEDDAGGADLPPAPEPPPASPRRPWWRRLLGDFY